jgi:hypothetical protein
VDPKKPSYLDRQFREADKRAAENEHEKAKKKILANTARLKALRLAKEAEDKAAKAQKPQKPRKPATKKGLPAFERE